MELNRAHFGDFKGAERIGPSTKILFDKAERGRRSFRLVRPSRRSV